MRRASGETGPAENFEVLGHNSLGARDPHLIQRGGNVYALVAHTEVMGDRAYAAWYTNGIVALDLSPLNDGTPSDPTMVGQFIPGASFPEVWGVAIRETDGAIFVSDIGSGLWIIRPTGPAAP